MVCLGRVLPLLAVLCGLAVPLPVRADGMAEAMERAYRDWHMRHRLQRSAIAFVRDGAIIGTAAIGEGASPSKPEPVASVSKSITGLCVVKLVEEGRLRYADTLGALLRGYYAERGGPSDPRFDRITVADLLTHSSGIAEGHIPDRPRLADQVADTKKERLGDDPGKKYQYNNKNYQVLGFLIEIVGRERYEDYCRRTILKPAGVEQASISRLQPFMSSWGGWVISARDYARVMRYFDPRYGLLRTGPRDWPKFGLGDRRSMGPGMLVRHNEDGSYSLWHDGVWTWRGDRLKYQFMARFVFWGASQTGFVMNAAPSMEGVGVDLESELWKISTGRSYAGKPAGRPQASVDVDLDRPGLDFTSFEMPRFDVEACRQTCDADRRCHAYAVTKPGTRGPRAKCWLKDGVPGARKDSCCVSGVFR